MNRFEKVTGFYPSDVASLYFIGFAYESLGEDDQARKYYRDVLKVNPMNLQAHQRLAFLYEKEGKVEKAIETYRNTLDFFGEEDSSDVLWVKGRLSPLEKRYTVNLSQVLFAYDSNPSGVFNNGGDTYSAFSGTFNYYLKKDRLLQIPFAFSTDNTVFYRLNNILSNETLSVAATTFQDPYSLTFDYSFNFGCRQGRTDQREDTQAFCGFSEEAIHPRCLDLSTAMLIFILIVVKHTMLFVRGSA
ncbi:MAG: tetratricopeptide repeat protein [Candidatus Manganitrophus sp.]|nr:tetratricopeptide repeat protein [Candidatus Manganitrophus sp.]